MRLLGVRYAWICVRHQLDIIPQLPAEMLPESFRGCIVAMNHQMTLLNPNFVECLDDVVSESPAKSLAPIWTCDGKMLQIAATAVSAGQHCPYKYSAVSGHVAETLVSREVGKQRTACIRITKG
jgi:hypothetical protein